MRLKWKWNEWWPQNEFAIKTNSNWLNSKDERTVDSSSNTYAPFTAPGWSSVPHITQIHDEASVLTNISLSGTYRKGPDFVTEASLKNGAKIGYYESLKYLTRFSLYIFNVSLIMILTEDFLIIEKCAQHFTVLYYNVDKDVLNTHQQLKYN